MLLVREVIRNRSEINTAVVKQRQSCL